MARGTKTKNGTAANVGYEAELWQMADALRGSMDAAEYKHVVLGLIFLKYISDAFEEQHAKLEAEQDQGADPEDPDEYRALNIFWVPPEARWSHLKAQAKQPTIGQLVDDAMAGIERDNPSLKGVLPKDYARPALDKQRLGQLIDLISNIRSATPRAAPRTCSAASTSTSSPSSPAPRARRAASSTRRAAWSSCWSRCSNPTRAGCTTPAAAPRACSCSRSSSSALQRQRQRRPGPERHQHLRPGVELHHLAAGDDEPRHPRHRRPDRPRRQLPQRPLPGPQGRLHPCQSALQRQRLGWRSAARWTSAGSTACRRQATPTSPGCST